MKIIRDTENFGIMMVPLFVDWNIRRCNFKDCKERPNTIITDAGCDVFGLCEAHFQIANVEGGATLSLELNDFDAFKEEAKPIRSGVNSSPRSNLEEL